MTEFYAQGFRAGYELAKAELLDIHDALLSAIQFAERFSDVKDGDDGQPEPNDAMRLVSQLESALEVCEKMIDKGTE